MPWQTFSDSIYLALLHNALHFILCNFTNPAIMAAILH